MICGFAILRGVIKTRRLHLPVRLQNGHHREAHSLQSQ